MSSESDTGSATIREGVYVLIPLNSKQLTAGQLRHSAVALEVLSSGTSADIRLIIEGKLTKLGRKPLNIEVAMDKGTPMAVLDLQDESGTFLTVQAEDPADPAETTNPSNYNLSILVIYILKVNRQI